MEKLSFIFLFRPRLTEGPCHSILNFYLVQCEKEKRQDAQSWVSEMLGQFAGIHFSYKGLAYRLETAS